MSARKWSIVEKKKPTASWLGAGVRVRKGAVLQQIAKNNAVTLTEITQNVKINLSIHQFCLELN